MSRMSTAVFASAKQSAVSSLWPSLLAYRDFVFFPARLWERLYHSLGFIR